VIGVAAMASSGVVGGVVVVVVTEVVSFCDSRDC
jgi:hypothetical protein